MPLAFSPKNQNLKKKKKTFQPTLDPEENTVIVRLNYRCWTYFCLLISGGKCKIGFKRFYHLRRDKYMLFYMFN